MTVLRLVPMGALLILAACGKEVSRDAVAARRAERQQRVAAAHADTAPFVVKLAGVPMELASAVMQLGVSSRDMRLTITDARSRRAAVGGADHERLEEIPGSRVVSEPGVVDTVTGEDAGTRVVVRVPVLTGERYLLQVEPLTTPAQMAMLTLGADGMALASLPVPLRPMATGPALFEVAITSRGVEVGPEIERVEIVPSCGTTHLVRSSGRADVYAQYRVEETGETGDVHLPPRSVDARFQSVSFRTRTPGSLRITYLGHELASAALPADCADPR
jgi:hypothetical protein